MKRILIVDDDATLRSTLSHYLDNCGYCVQMASSGAEALNLIETDPPDLIVSDVLMPHMDGFEFCRQLRSTRVGQLIPFLFLSAQREVDNRIKGHGMGADDYLTKPFEPRELVAKIEAQLERARRIHSEIINLIQSAGVKVPQTYSSTEGEPAPLPVTPAEEKVFWQVVQGYTNKQIGERLFISPRTVQTHLSNILSKLNLENRSQLVRFAFEQGYRPPEDEVEPSLNT